MKKLTLATAILMSFSCMAANTATDSSFDNSAVIQLDGAQSTTVVIEQVTAGTEGKNQATVKYDGPGDKVGGGANIYQNGDDNIAMVEFTGHAHGNFADIDQVGYDNKAYIDVTQHGDGNDSRIKTTGSENFAKVEYKGQDADWNYVQILQGNDASDKFNRVNVSLEDSMNNDLRLTQTQSNAAISVSLDNSRGNDLAVTQNHRDYTRVTGDGAKWNTVRVTQD